MNPELTAYTEKETGRLTNRQVRQTRGGGEEREIVPNLSETSFVFFTNHKWQANLLLGTEIINIHTHKMYPPTGKIRYATITTGQYIPCAKQRN